MSAQQGLIEQLIQRPLFGLETEYGVHAPDNPAAQHSRLSLDVINAYASLMLRQGTGVAGSEWDYGEESPLVDARGWTMPRSAAHPSQLTDEPLGPEQVAYEAIHAELAAGTWREELSHPLMNLVLTNGARFYVDHAHPEYSSPETTHYRDAVCWDQAGEIIARRAVDFLASEQQAQIRLYKNNTDNKGVSYGAHENYLVARSVDFDHLAEALIPFFVSRQIICGAGRLGQGIGWVQPQFQISQRADFFEERIGLETTIRRPIINTRDEPHARAEDYRRLHVIIGDANLSEYSTWLRVGATDVVLALLSTGYTPGFQLMDPVAALQQISHDVTLTTKVACSDGVARTAIEIQRHYLAAAEKFFAQARTDADRQQEITALLQGWDEVLADLSQDIFRAADRVEWVSKYQLITQLCQRSGINLNHPKAAMLDLQYADIDPSRGLYYKLRAAGRTRRVVSDTEINAAADQAPETTRAYLRGNTVKHFSQLLCGASWETLLLARPGSERVNRILLADPFQGTAAQAAALFRGNVEEEDFIRSAQQLSVGRTEKEV